MAASACSQQGGCGLKSHLAVVNIEAKQSRALERPFTKLVSIMCHSGQGTTDGMTDVDKEMCVYHPSAQLREHL